VPVATAVTGGWNVVSPPKYYEESSSVYGSAVATANASGIFGANSGITIEINPNTNEFRALGSENIYSQVVGRVGVKARVAFGLVNSSSAYLNYACRTNLNASGDVSKSINVVWSQRTFEDGSTFITTYFALLGARPNSYRTTGRAGAPYTAETELIAKSFTYTTVASTYYSSIGAEPTDAVWNFEDGGANPVTLFGRVVDCTDFNWSVDRDLKEIFVLGASTVAFLPPGNRSITGDFTAIYVSGSTISGDLLTQTSGTISWVMKTSAGTPTFSSATLINHSLPIEIASETYERVSFRANLMSTI